MMEWYILLSDAVTHMLRLFLGFCFVTKPGDFVLNKKALVSTVVLGGLLAVFGALFLPGPGTAAGEILFLGAAAWYFKRERLQMSLFLILFYEIGVGLWDFLMSSWLGVFFLREGFIRPDTVEHRIGVWAVRLIMVGIGLFLAYKGDARAYFRAASVAAVAGLAAVVTLSEQTRLSLDEDAVGTWIILAMVLLFALLFYRLSRQREMEAQIARLKETQARIVGRDYEALRKIYGDNAKLYHDLHNHIESIYQCLIQGNISEATAYCEALRGPVGEISQNTWTMDKAVDYLISSKMALAASLHIQTKVNIEYPRNTNIRSVDLTTILGNLLDNALEALQNAPASVRFLSLTIRRINDMLIIKVENGCSREPSRADGKWVTSKEDKAFHGWGLESTRTAAMRYDGVVNADYEDGIFCAVVTLSFQPVQTAAN